MKFYLDKKEIVFEPENLLIAGYTARDQKSLQAHIEELKKIGVAAPNQVPMVYDLSPELLSTRDFITTVKNDGSGEAEVVLLSINGKWYVGLGSDHTDRKLEAVSVHKSKQVCAKPISNELWELASIEDHWDDIELKSWMVLNGKEQLYQAGKLGDFLPPKELLEIIKERGYSTTNTVLFCGTPPLKTDKFLYGEKFRAELSDSKTNKKIKLSYEVKILTDSKED
ncbi:DUF2848 family protein [Pueribacillus theae]|uniref:DUF2848 family protein n=1 Tax=Pueribacillus theae TaxID=2171751 RepID=UPI0014033097|nr:DUF2848 family protein [Pueribacillus theae]